MDGTVEYLWLPPGAKPPERACSPYRAIVAVEAAVEADWQAQVSDWLVRSGCRYMMAWGIECSGWDDAVDMATQPAWSAIQPVFQRRGCSGPILTRHRSLPLCMARAREAPSPISNGDVGHD